ncbi:MAG: nucleoside phosphorylase [Clostridia bacterium]
MDASNAPILEWDDDSSQVSKEYFFRQGKKDFSDFEEVMDKAVEKCIIFLPRAFEDCKEIYRDCKKVYDFKSASTISPIYLYKNKILIALCPLGGPAATNLVEELSYIGIRTFIACGSCGCLDETLDINTLIIPTDSIRDEGTSYHYMPASRTVETSSAVNKAIEKVLKRNKEKYIKSRIWSTDSIYRETPNRIARRKAEGAIGVEMECASIAAVAKYYNIYFGELLYFTDLIGPHKWDWRKYDKIALRTKILHICIDALDLL